MELEEVKAYLKIDYDDDDQEIQEAIEASQIYIDSMCGTSYKEDEKLVKLSNILIKKMVSDMYNNKSLSISSNFKRDIMVNSIFEKLSLSESGE